MSAKADSKASRQAIKSSVNANPGGVSRPEIVVGESGYETFAAAVNTLNAGGTDCALRVPSTLAAASRTVSSKLTVNANINLKVDRGAPIVVTIPEVNIEGLSRAAASIVAWTGHGLVTGDKIRFSGITQAGWTALNGTVQTVTYISDDSFSIPVDTSGYAADYLPSTDPGVYFKLLLINGPFEAGLYQVFSCTGTGKAVFGSGAIKEDYPQWWGGVGDNSTDSTTALAAAIEAFSTVKLIGIFKITSAIQPIQSGIMIYADSPASGGICQATAHTIGISINDDYTLHNFTLIGNSTFGTSSVAIVASSGDNKGRRSIVQDMVITGWGGTGINAYTDMQIDRNVIKDCGNEGIFVAGSGVKVRRNHIENTNGWGIDVNADNSDILENDLINCGSVKLGIANDYGAITVYGATAAGASNNRVLRNTIKGSDGPGIYLSRNLGKMTGNQVSLNIINNVGINVATLKFGIAAICNDAAYSLNGLSVSQNIVDTVTSGAGKAYYYAGIKNLKHGNNIANNIAYGIYLHGDMTIPPVNGVVISNDVVKNYGTAPLFIHSTSLNVSFSSLLSGTLIE